MSEEEINQDDQEFSLYTPLPHERLDTWGFVPNTRVWCADNSFRPVQALEKGDYVFGQTFQKEDVIVPDGDDGSELAKAWRPQLTARRVLGVRAVKARAWQMTFGDKNKQYEARRLVAGGLTRISTFPFEHDRREHPPMVRLHTILDNPRVGSETREAKKLDKEWSAEAGEPKYRRTKFSGQPRGDYSIVIPYEAYGGQVGHIQTSTRDYNRCNFAQVREVDVLHHRQPLVQVHVQPDTSEKFGASEQNPRVNMIAQTPFRNEEKKTQVAVDPNADNLDELSEVENMEGWDSYVDQIADAQEVEAEKTTYTKAETNMQGSFYETKNNEEIAEVLQEYYGLEGGFLNGGILVHPPMPAGFGGN